MTMAALAEGVKAVAAEHRDDPRQLLAILRALEEVHHEICRDWFTPALPNTRHELFDLLRDIEAHGGWPYIYRISLSDLCQRLARVDRDSLENVLEVGNDDPAADGGS